MQAPLLLKQGVCWEKFRNHRALARTTTLANAVPGSKPLEEPEARQGDQANDIESIDSESEDQESTPCEYKIKSYPADFTLEVLHNKWKSREIIIPPFQRRFVWKQAQASRLIESFLLDLPVPPIFLYEESDGKLMVIDGQQRLKSIFSFFDGVFESGESKATRSSRRKKPFGVGSFGLMGGWGGQPMMARENLPRLLWCFPLLAEPGHSKAGQ